jgi:DNA-binding CsgD family transcriptional regulator/tetratricopeptide (TPR) repeat protein
VALAGLDLPSVAALISSITGSPEDSVTAITVRERTGGNPFFVTEVARLGPAGPVPLGVREAIRARLRRLPEATRAVLSTASVLGRDFGGELLEGVSELCGASLVAALQPAAQARLIISDTERQGRYRFVHALVQEVLYDELSDEVRRATHARADDAIDRLAAPARDARIEEQAFHACAALDGPASRTRAAALCAAAGRRATAALAYEDAARWYGKALDIEPDLPSPDLLFAHADALARASRGVEARGQYEAAFHRAIRDGDGARAARAALGVGDGVASAGVIDESLLRMLEHAERLVARDDVVSIRLEARKAIELYWQPDRTPARETAARALMRAESGGHAKALGEALHARRFVLRGPDDLAERIALGERMVRLAENTGDEELELSAYAWLIPEYFAAGDIVLVGRAHAALDDLERSVRRPLARWHVHLFSGMRAVFEGRYTDALSTIERARYLGSRVGSQPADMFAAAQRAVVLRDFGRAAESIDELRRLSTAYPLLLTLSCEIAMLLAEVGQRAEASELLDRVAHDGFSVVPRDSLWRASIALAAQAASTLGHVAHARTAYELLLPFVGINVVQGVPVAWGATDHYLGIASVAAGELDAAIGHLDAAARLHGAWGASALGVASRAELANALHKRGRAEDRARVLGLEAAVRTQAQHLGIVRPLLARDRRAAADLSIPDAPLAGLTERERTIIGLLATGQANKEIAHALCISVHTVERHLANLYAKIGARNRADAAAYAVAHGHRRPPSGST